MINGVLARSKKVRLGRLSGGERLLEGRDTDGKCQKGESEDYTNVAENWKNPHRKYRGDERL